MSQEPDVWCVYTGEWWADDAALMNIEHIIPLSCGGHNSFTIKVNKQINSELGSEVDSKIINNPLVATARRHYRLKGQSKNDPKSVWPVEIGNLKGSLNMTPDVPIFSTYRSNNKYGLNVRRPVSGEKVQTTFKLDENLLLRFGCKVALGTGYFLFGDVFQNYGYHQELRDLMNSNTPVKDLNFLVSMNGGKGFWGLGWPKSLKTDSIFPAYWDAISSVKGRHLIFTEHTTREIILGISLFGGLFRWYFNIAKVPYKFPIGGDFELGAVIELDLKKRQYRRTDLRSFLIPFMLNLKKKT